MFTMYHTILLFVHCLYTLFSTIRKYCLIARQKCIDLWYRNKLKAEVEMLVENVNRMKKIPRHLVIVFGQKEKSILDCIQIIVWCITLGIPYISFYDRDDFFIKNGNIIKREFSKQRPNLAEQVNWSYSITMSTQNGITDKHKPKLQVLFLSYLDGKNRIVSLTQALAEATARHHLTPEEINTDLLNEKLKFNGIPDPELALIFGRTCSTYGLLPWHTRTTEFLTSPLNVNLPVKEFICLLQTYDKTEQRYGK